MSSETISTNKTSPSKRRLSTTDNKENEPPTKAFKSIKAIYSEDYKIPIEDYPPPNAKLLKRFASDFETGMDSMRLQNADEPEDGIFANPGGSSLLKDYDRRIKKLEQEMRTAEQEMRTAKVMYQRRMDVIETAFENEFKKAKHPHVDKHVLIRGNRSAHIPKLLETLETFDARDLHERFRAKFEDSFACGRKFAESLQDFDPWVKLVDYAARVIWTSFDIKDDSIEWKFWNEVHRFNKGLTKTFSTPLEMKAAMERDEWKMTLSTLLQEGEIVDQLIYDRSLENITHELGEVPVKKQKEPSKETEELRDPFDRS